MRKSKCLDKLRQGEVASCVKMNLADPRAFEIGALAGLDCLWTDMEHVGNDWSAVERQVFATKAHDADLLVRVAKGSYSDYIKPLELDASAIMIPHVMTRDEARDIVEKTRFHPLGRRPLDGGNADGMYCGMDLGEYIDHCNRNRMIIVQIEDPEAMDELDAIAGVEGIDMLFFGPGDFSHGLGVPGKLDDPRLLEARRAVAEAALANGKFAGTVGSPEGMPVLLELGYRFISMGADVVGLSTYFRGMVSAFQKAESRSTRDGDELRNVYR